MIIGLTGMSGAGKSTAAKAFQQLGFYVIDCDKEAKAVISRSPCIDEVFAAFPEIFTDGELDRKKAAEILFADGSKLKHYQSIVFPHVLNEITRQLSIINCQSPIVLDAPTLYQSGADSLCDEVIAVIADRACCIKRIVQRDGISEKQAQLRLDNQHDEDFFRLNADYVTQNNARLNEFVESIKNIGRKMV